MEMRGRAVVDFLNGVNSMRDGTLVGLSLRSGKFDWEPILHIKFNVPRGTLGSAYELILQDDLSFDYLFTDGSTLEPIAFVKCLWINNDTLFLSIDPERESDRFKSDNDDDWFQSKSVMLTISKNKS